MRLGRPARRVARQVETHSVRGRGVRCERGGCVVSGAAADVEKPTAGEALSRGGLHGRDDSVADGRVETGSLNLAAGRHHSGVVGNEAVSSSAREQADVTLPGEVEGVAPQAAGPDTEAAER